jgi:hypothetical protein
MPPHHVKKDEPKEEWEQLPPGLEEETRPWWVVHRELQVVLFRHPDNPEDAPSQTLVVAHSLAAAGKVVDLASHDDEDVKPVVKKDGGGDDINSGRYGGVVAGAAAEAVASATSSFYNILSLNFCKNHPNLL